MSEFSLKQIQVFVAVAELGSFTQAAQALFLSQSTVSAHLAALETALSPACWTVTHAAGCG